MSWTDLYQFKPHYFLTGEGHRIHYVDEGAGVPIVMFHGTPTWSFMYRNLITSAVANGYRALAPDNIGLGMSDKPQDWGYHLEDHIRSMEEWLESLHLRDFVLVCHDWGGGIGMGIATRHPDWIRRIVLMNTAAFPSRDCPWSIYLLRLPGIGALLIRLLNLFVPATTRMAVAKPMGRDVADAYMYPYGSRHDRIAVLRFVQDIPLTRRHPTYRTLSEIESRLHLLKSKDIRLLWGERDFCFHMGFYKKMREIFPDAYAESFPDAGHYLLEDSGEKIIPKILADIPGDNDACGR